VSKAPPQGFVHPRGGLVKILPATPPIDTFETLFPGGRHEAVARPLQKGEETKEEDMQIGRMGAGFSGLLAVAAFLAVEAPTPSEAVPQRIASAQEIDQAVSFAHAQADAVSGKNKPGR
jgi:hypothetical protein